MKKYKVILVKTEEVTIDAENPADAMRQANEIAKLSGKD